ncbi:hypothetical protein LINPERHAP2_LOCUS5656, partial [Linum perenne]
LRLIEDRIGKIVCINHTTLEGSRSNFARISVEVDLSKSLLSKYRLRRRVPRIEYEAFILFASTAGVMVIDMPSVNRSLKLLLWRIKLRPLRTPFFKVLRIPNSARSWRNISIHGCN